MEDGKIIFTTEDGEEIAFYILEETTISGDSYLLVTDSTEEEAEALILKELKGDNDEESIYDVVEDEQELKAISKVFEELLEDIDINM
ncbi:MAG: DUF1292 domain-containing protein [Velocimicrobium sp.]